MSVNQPENELRNQEYEALKKVLVKTISPSLSKKRGSTDKNSEHGDKTGGDLSWVGYRQWERIGEEILDLHDAYTSRLEGFKQQENPIHEQQAGYQLYFLPRNFYRALQVLEGMSTWEGKTDESGAHTVGTGIWLDQLLKGSQLNVLDLGCGTGAFSLALIHWLSNWRKAAPLTIGGLSRSRFTTLEITLVDQGRGILNLAKSNLKAYADSVLQGVELKLSTKPDGVEAFMNQEEKAGHYSLVLGGMMLNELNLLGPRRAHSKAIHLAQGLVTITKPGGVVALVEPGTRKGYMNIMAMREQIGRGDILYPCPHKLKCPLWGAEVKNWCHANLNLPREFFFDELLKKKAGIGFQMNALNLFGMAYRIGDKEYRSTFDPPKSGGRLVSNLLRSKEKVKRSHGKPLVKPDSSVEKVFLLCQPNGRLSEVPARSLGAFKRGNWMTQEDLAKIRLEGKSDQEQLKRTDESRQQKKSRRYRKR